MKASDLDALREGFQGEAFAAQDVCPICSRASTIVGRASNIHPERPAEVDLRRCRSCKHVWVDPMPRQDFLSHLYGRGSNSVIGAGWEGRDAGEMSIPECSVENAERDQRPGRYFELGLGKGKLYSQFLDRGWTCSGVEPGEWGQHLEGVVASIHDVPIEPVWNVLVAIDVFEHLSQPLEALRAISGLAAPHSRLYAAFPNNQSFRFVTQKSAWRMVRPLGHVHYFSRKSLNALFDTGGYKVVSRATNDMAIAPSLRTPKSYASPIIQALGLGDQWFVKAVPKRSSSG